MRDIGISPSRRRRLLHSGQLVSAGVRTLRLSGVARTFEMDVMAACLDLDAVASHRTAAHLHGLAGFSHRPTRIEVTVPEGRGRTRSPGATVHRSTNLGLEDLVTVGPIPTTSVARTILGLAALVPDIDIDRVRDAVDTAVRDGIASDAWLWWRLEELRCRGRNGVTVMEQILQRRAGRGKTESWLEREFLLLLEQAGLPPPTVQRRVCENGAFVARVDCCYDTQRLIVELNGHAAHSTKRQRDTDAARVNRLQLLGYRVLQFTYDDVVQRPEMVIATVAGALAIGRAVSA
jgi:hypothetical protein